MERKMERERNNRLVSEAELPNEYEIKSDYCYCVVCYIRDICIRDGYRCFVKNLEWEVE
ncbi:MAG: hypothetical protein QXN71_02010 [Candidatus Aenigmatarchaeota archaeon]